MDNEMLICDNGNGYTVRWAHNKRALKKFQVSLIPIDDGTDLAPPSQDPFADMRSRRTKEDCLRLAEKYVCHIKKVLALVNDPLTSIRRKQIGKES